MAILLKESGEVERVKCDGSSFKEMKKIIGNGCTIVEPVRFGNLYAVGDEEAKCKKHEVNLVASCMYRALMGGDYMGGNVIVLADAGNGKMRDLTPVEEVAFLSFVKKLMAVYKSGKLGSFKATGPHCEVLEFSTGEDMMAYIKDGDERHASKKDVYDGRNPAYDEFHGREGDGK